MWDTFLEWKGPMVRKGWRLVWKAEPSCFFWSVWNARNRIVFGDEALSIQKLKF